MYGPPTGGTSLDNDDFHMLEVMYFTQLDICLARSEEFIPVSTAATTGALSLKIVWIGEDGRHCWVLFAPGRKSIEQVPIVG